MTSSISFSCAECGSADFIFPNDPPKDDDIVQCAGCKREIGRYDVVSKALMDAGKAEVGKMIPNIFGKPVKLDWKDE